MEKNIVKNIFLGMVGLGQFIPTPFSMGKERKENMAFYSRPSWNFLSHKGRQLAGPCLGRRPVNSDGFYT